MQNLIILLTICLFIFDLGIDGKAGATHETAEGFWYLASACFPPKIAKDNPCDLTNDTFGDTQGEIYTPFYVTILLGLPIIINKLIDCQNRESGTKYRPPPIFLDKRVSFCHIKSYGHPAENLGKNQRVTQGSGV